MNVHWTVIAPSTLAPSLQLISTLWCWGKKITISLTWPSFQLSAASSRILSTQSLFEEQPFIFLTAFIPQPVCHSCSPLYWNFSHCHHQWSPRCLNQWQIVRKLTLRHLFTHFIQQMIEVLLHVRGMQYEQDWQDLLWSYGVCILVGEMRN